MQDKILNWAIADVEILGLQVQNWVLVLIFGAVLFVCINQFIEHRRPY
jgi:hypothetical protein